MSLLSKWFRRITTVPKSKRQAVAADIVTELDALIDSTNPAGLEEALIRWVSSKLPIDPVLSRAALAYLAHAELSHILKEADPAKRKAAVETWVHHRLGV